jgi:branched-chain amino acid transport system permease protein
VIQDEEGARLCGVNPAMVRSLVFALSGVLAALVAVTRSMTSPVTVNAGIDFTILALIVAVVGGLGSASGAFLAGVLLGIVNTVSAHYIGSYVTTIVLLVAAALTIVLRPSGLLGVGRE